MVYSIYKGTKCSIKYEADMTVSEAMLPGTHFFKVLYRVFFFSLVPPQKVLSTEKLIQARLGVSWTIYVNVDSPNLGFPYFNFLGGYQ